MVVAYINVLKDTITTIQFVLLVLTDASTATIQQLVESAIWDISIMESAQNSVQLDGLIINLSVKNVSKAVSNVQSRRISARFVTAIYFSIFIVVSQPALLAHLKTINKVPAKPVSLPARHAKMPIRARAAFTDIFFTPSHQETSV